LLGAPTLRTCGSASVDSSKCPIGVTC
jgi:hypothetical protein